MLLARPRIDLRAANKKDKRVADLSAALDINLTEVARKVHEDQNQA